MDVLKRKKDQKWFDSKYSKKENDINISYKDLTGPLKIEDFTNLKSINCSHNRLTSLDLSDCSELRSLTCSHNQLNSLNLSGCSELRNLYCSHNQLISLNLSGCSKLESLDYSNNPPDLDVGKEKINLLIIGRTGGGKSALANVLSDIDEFEESARSVVSKTRNFQKKEFDLSGTKYRVIETVNDQIDQMKEAIDLMSEGISQVLFVVDGIFTKEMETFIFDSGITEYTTIVRTKFSDFKNKGVCKIDREDLRKENEKIKSCSIIYVDNPPIKFISDGGVDEDDELTIRINKKRRDQSKKILQDHLEAACKGKYYKLKGV